MKRLLFVFLDGVGIGPAGPQNPFATAACAALKELAGGQSWAEPFGAITEASHHVSTLDATLGVEGLPQSGTGQATLLTGQNCAELVGRHFGPFPHSRTHEAIDQAGLFQKVHELPLPAPAFANAFPPQYFNREGRRWDSVTTRCSRAAGLLLRDITALREGRALAADLSGDAWRTQLDLSVPRQDATTAAEVLAALARNHSLTFFEYFLTDKVGHRRIDTSPETLLSTLDRFFGALLEELCPSEEALLITSDHGNLEDTSHTQHTRNPVPLLVHGWAAPYFANAKSLADVTPRIMDALQATRPQNAPASPGAR